MNSRNYYLSAFIFCALLLGGAYYLQYVVGLKPCVLCILQRVVYFAIAIITLLAVVINPRGVLHKIFATLLSLVSFLGVLIAGRQTWMQYFPPADVGCGPNLNFMLHNFPLSQVIETLFYGSGNCALVTWRFIGLSMAEWSLLFFCGFFAVFLYLLIRTYAKIRSIN